MNKCCWKNGANRLVPRRVATNLQFVRNAVSAKCNKMRSACNYLIGWFKDEVRESLQSARNGV